MQGLSSTHSSELSWYVHPSWGSQMSMVQALLSSHVWMVALWHSPFTQVSLEVQTSPSSQSDKFTAQISHAFAGCGITRARFHTRSERAGDGLTHTHTLQTHTFGGTGVIILTDYSVQQRDIASHFRDAHRGCAYSVVGAIPRGTCTGALSVHRSSSVQTSSSSHG